MALLGMRMQMRRLVGAWLLLIATTLVSTTVAFPTKLLTGALEQLSRAEVYTPSRRLLDDEEEDMTVYYLLTGVCFVAFTPPCICKLRQVMFASSQIADEYADE